MSPPTSDPWAWLDVRPHLPDCFTDARTLLSFDGGLFDKLRGALEQPLVRSPKEEVEELVERWEAVRRLVGAAPQRLEKEVEEGRKAGREATDENAKFSVSEFKTLHRRLRQIGAPLIVAARERMLSGGKINQSHNAQKLGVISKPSLRSRANADIALGALGHRARFAAASAGKRPGDTVGEVHWFEIELRHCGNFQVAQHPADPWAVEVKKRKEEEEDEEGDDFSTAVNYALRAFGPTNPKIDGEPGEAKAPGGSWSVFWRLLQPGGEQGRSLLLGPKLNYEGESATGAFALACAWLSAGLPCEPRVVVMAGAVPSRKGQSAPPRLKPVEGIAAKVRAVIAAKADGLKAEDGRGPWSNAKEFPDPEANKLTEQLQRAAADFDTIALLDESPGIGSQTNWQEARATLGKARRQGDERGQAAAGLSLWNLATGQRWTES